MSPLQAKIHFTLHTNIYNRYINNMVDSATAGQDRKSDFICIIALHQFFRVRRRNWKKLENFEITGFRVFPRKFMFLL